MKPTSDITVLCFDHGLFLPVAHRMAKECKRVLYATPWETGFAKLGNCIVGDGFDDIERCDDIWAVMPEVDLVVFPDIQHAGLQLHLESIGKPVWGARAADSLEIDRHKFLDVMAKTGLPMPEQTTVVGVSKLRQFLKHKGECYIKISKFRGDHETRKWKGMDSDEGWIDALAVKFGPAKEYIPFLVFEPIDAAVEDGLDTYCVDGQWPSLVLHGLENKDKCYLGAVTPRDEMPKELTDILDAFGPIFKDYRYRNQFSMEARNGVFIDPTCRGGLPSTASQLANWSNFPDIVWCGANGILVEPEPAHNFSAEAILSIKTEKDQWSKARFEGEICEHVHLAGACLIDGAHCWPPDGAADNNLGWLQAGGDSIEEAIENLKRLAEELPDGVSAATDELVGLLKTMQEGEKEGLDFGGQPPPDPVMAIE